jgi:DNA-binding MarR family transcriptional regulator
MKGKAPQQKESTALTPLFPIACACQNLRRATRLVSRIYDEELRKADMELTQFSLMTGLSAVGEANQKTLSAGFAMDSTTLTRNLALLLKRRWVDVKPGTDRRQRLYRLTELGKRQLAIAKPHWQEAQGRLRQALGESGWEQMQSAVRKITHAASDA